MPPPSLPRASILRIVAMVGLTGTLGVCDIASDAIGWRVALAISCIALVAIAVFEIVRAAADARRERDQLARHEESVEQQVSAEGRLVAHGHALHGITADTSALRAGQAETNDLLRQLLADKQPGVDPTIRPTLTPDQQAAVDAARAMGDAEAKAGAAIVDRDRSAADAAFAEWEQARKSRDAVRAAEDFRFHTRLGDKHYFFGEFDEAIDPYEKALHLRESDPIAIHNLAITLIQARRNDTERTARLDRAIGLLHRLLTIYTRAAAPFDWAMTQNNLGAAWKNYPAEDRRESLDKAIACYTAALEVRTRAAAPFQWAMTQNNLGNAWQEYPADDRRESLDKAIACYTAALEVFTRAAAPHHHGIVLRNLERARRERDSLEP